MILLVIDNKKLSVEKVRCYTGAAKYMEKLEKILKETEDFFYVDDGKIAKLAENLTEHMNNKLYFNPTPLKVNKGTVINGDYSTKNLRQSFFYDCKFKDADYKDASLAGSLFNNTHFDEGDYLNTNLQSCDFRNCNFENIITGLNYTRFSKSIFIGTNFHNCKFKGVLMNDVIFTDCKFIDCQWIPIAVENTIFKNTLLRNVKLKSMNLEFSTFDNIKLDRVTLPFPTIPYIFNGLNYLKNTSDIVRITSAKAKNGISVDEYFENLDDLEKFYKFTNNYFPLTNILICKGMYKEAFASVINGINLSIELRRFRMLRNYCRQLNYIENISIHDRQSLYRHILNKVYDMHFQDFEYENLNNYLPEIRQLLLDDMKGQKLEIYLLTNISNEETDKLSFLIGIIEHLLTPNCNYSIELRHNSPWEIFIRLFTDPNNISNIISFISLVFSAIQTKIMIDQHLESKQTKNLESKQIEEYQKLLREKNIIINNLIINNNGNIQINNTINNE